MAVLDLYYQTSAMSPKMMRKNRQRQDPEEGMLRFQQRILTLHLQRLLHPWEAPGLSRRPLQNPEPLLQWLEPLSLYNEFDSFILRQLRGWRLLQGACLSAEEWRAVMASTSNRLDYGNVTAALTVLFDEQAISRQHGGHHHQQQGGPSIFSMDYDDGWEDWSSWDPSYYGYYAGWEDDYGGGHYEEDFEDALEENEVKNDDEAAASVKGDKEAMVQQTWSQAHRSTQMARKDRGFGKGSSSAKGEGCFICGNPNHYSRQCPDRFAPNSKGKGKSMNYAWPEDDDWAYAAAAHMKGKAKGKGYGGKNANYMDELYYAFKGKHHGKGKGKFKSKNQGTVNAYTMDYVGFHGLEIDADPAMDLHASVKGNFSDPQMRQSQLVVAWECSTLAQLAQPDQKGLSTG